MSTDGQRQAWVKPTLILEGNLEELVLAVPGKLSVTPGDLQENRKEQASG